jgi:hypothetical protein
VTDEPTTCACRGGVSCLFHYAELSLSGQLAAAHAAGIRSGTGRVSLGASGTGRPERSPDGRRSRRDDSWRVEP